MRATAALLAAVLAAAGLVLPARAAEPAPPPAWPAWLPPPPPIPPPPANAVPADNAGSLVAAVEGAKPGATILIAPGVYALPRKLVIRADGVTLRGRTGAPADVILDGGPAGLGELLGVARARDVTFAGLTIRNVRWNRIKIDSETGVQRLVIRNCVIHNVWQRGVKGVKVPPENREALRPAGCRIEGCLFANDRPKAFADDPDDTAATFGGNYVGGIDVMYAKGWTIRGNVFLGLRGRTGEARGAVFLWHEAEDCVVERNVVIDCDTGICLGNSHKPGDVPVHASRCVVRNNFVARAPEAGILADYTRDCRILHNTVHDPESRLGRLIRVAHDNPGLVVANNLLDGAAVRLDTQQPVDLRGNLRGDYTALFVDAARGDLHLKPGAAAARGKAVPQPDVTDDIDGQARSGAPDAGADEHAGR